MNKKESKYFATASKMDEALMELLEKKEFEYITIKEICDKAGVNRSTFYLHYENTADLLSETTRYVVDKFLTYFNNRSINFQEGSLKDLVFIKREYLVPYLTFIKENQRIFKTALGHLGIMGFEAYYDRMFSHIFNPILERFGIDIEERQYVMKYYLTGMTALSMEWLREGCKMPVERVCEIIVKCTTGRLGVSEDE